MPRTKTAALEAPPAGETETVMATCTSCGAHVPVMEIADHVCDPDAAAQEPQESTEVTEITETAAQDGPRPVYATTPTETWAPWVLDDVEQLAHGDIGDATHAVIVFSDEKPPQVAGVNDSYDGAVAQAGSIAERGILQGELRVFAIDDIRAAGASGEYVEVDVDLDQVAAEAAQELGIAEIADTVFNEATAQIATAAGITDTVEEARELLAETAADGNGDEQAGAETGQLFPTPRPEISRDLRDPDELVLNFSGAVPMERGNPAQVEFFNALQTGDQVDLRLTIRVGAEALRARLDKEREYVKDRVLAKSLIVSEVHFDEAG